jgi:hypothetical protein
MKLISSKNTTKHQPPIGLILIFKNNRIKIFVREKQASLPRDKIHSLLHERCQGEEESI